MFPQKTQVCLLLCLLPTAFPVSAAIVAITVQGVFVPNNNAPGGPEDHLNLNDASYSGVFHYDTEEPLFYLEEEEVFPSGEKYMLGAFDSLPSFFQITNRPNGAADVFHSYTPSSWSVLNFYSDGTLPDKILPVWGNFFLDNVEVFTPAWQLRFHDQDFFPGMVAPFAPTFSESDYEAVGYIYENDYILDISATVEIVPIPAAAWLFGSALGLLGWMRRKKA
jgi:hypothetical protein